VSTFAADLAEGQAALDRGAWLEAGEAFRRALECDESPEALEGLGLSAWWLDEAEVVFDARQRAYRGYLSRNDVVSAARVATWIAWDSSAFRGDDGVANGWLQRAARLLEGQPDSREHAFLAARAAVFALGDQGDPDRAEALSTEAIRVSRALAIADYEMVGRSLRGWSRVTVGRVAEGLRELDEVSAAILGGEISDRLLIGLAGCYLIAACERIRDHDRVIRWCDRIREHSRKVGLRPLFAVCRTQYASICMSRGSWEEAERELTSACDELAICRPGMTLDGLARLGELRRRQGRLDDAALLFERSGAHPVASLGRAAIALDRGDPRAAVELADRHLRRIPAANRIERAPGLELLVHAHAASGVEQLDAAHAALEQLRDLAADAATSPLRAGASFAAGVVALAAGEHDAARVHLEDAVDLFERSGAPYDVARARLALARALAQLGRSAAALAEAERALDQFTALEASLDMAAAEQLRTVLRSPGSATGKPQRVVGGLTAREIEVLRLISAGLSNQAIAAQLCISEHTVHRHVANTLTKFDVSSRSAAVARAARLGLI
jgi:DNA-binding NarL/FixJ family response regulator